MKKLAIVRHGKYGMDDRLNDEGREQIEQLAELLKPIVDGSSILILTSTADRARESAEILSLKLSAELHQHEILWSENSHPEDFPGTLELVRSQQEKADVVILVTHYEYAEGFPAFFADKELDFQLEGAPIDKGQAWLIDCCTKTSVLVI